MFLRKVLGSLRPGSHFGKRSIALSPRANSISPLGRRRLRLEPLEDRQMLSITLFVDADSTAQFQDGLDWTHAYTDLQSALTRAAELNADGIANNDVEAIWIAEGTYCPTAELESGDVRSASFSLVDGVSLYGGFAGTETSLDQRDLSACTTTLSGDLGVSGDVSDNAYTVVYCGEDVTASLDGVAVTGGNADGTEDSNHPERNSGSGIFSEGTLAIVDSIIADNFANANGGGIYNTATGRVTLEGVEVSENRAFAGAGIYNEGTLAVDSATITGNTTNSYNTYYDTVDYNENEGTLCLTLYGKGGGIYSSGTLSVSNSAILNNAATQGGGIYNDGDLHIQNSNIVENQAPAITGTWTSDNEEARFSSYYMYDTIVEENKGGGIFNASEATLTIEDTEVSENSAIFGAGIYNEGTIALTNSTISENSTPGSSGLIDYIIEGEGNGTDEAMVSVSLFLRGKGGGIYNSGTLNVSSSTFVNNFATEGGGICNYGNANIETTIFSDNKSTYGAGIANRGTLKVANSQFQENLVSFHYVYGEDCNGMGAGIYNYRTGTANIVNSLFAKNEGHGILSYGQVTVVNSTITGNRASSGAGIYVFDNEESIAELYNTIVAENETCLGAWGFQGDNPDVGGYVIGSNNIIGDGTGLSGLVDGVNGNQIGTAESPIDPRFSVTTQGETGLIQYELLSDSPAIDAGDASLLPADVTDMDGDGDTTEPIPFDIGGADRVQGYTVNIGAYETYCETDADLQVGPILYVDATPYDSDSSWKNVYTDLQSALDLAAELNSDDIPENDVEAIWIAEGTYLPTISAATVLIDTIPPTSSVTSSSAADTSTGTSSGGDFVGNTESTDDTPADVSMVTYIPTLEDGIWGRPLYDSARAVCFSLVDGVSLYGGFAGTETSLDERDLSSHETILSGDLGVLGDTSDNAYTVVYCGEDITAGLDGVTVTDGNADALIGTQGKSDGGGIYNLGTLAVANCVISDNTVGESGGGIYNVGVLSVTNSTILNNFAPSKYDYPTPSGGWNICYAYTPCCGGGIYNSGDLTVINSTITGNSAEHGGGICNENGTLTVTNSTFSDNSSGIYNVGSSAAATLDNTIVAGNRGSDINVLYRMSARSSSGSWTGNPFSGSNNLIGKSSADSGLVDGADGNQVGTADAPLDPMLSDLVQFLNRQYGYYPLAGSPLVDAGNNDLLSDGVTADIAGNERIYNGTVDIGACESVPVIVTVVDVDDVSLIPEGEVLPVKRTSFTPPADPALGMATVPRRSELPPRQLIRPVSELADVVFAESVSEQALWSSDDLAAIAKEFQMVTVRKTTDESESNPSFALELGLYVDLD